MAAKEEKHLNESEKYNSEKLPDTEHVSNTFIKTPCKIKDDFYIVTDNAENTPQNIKSQGFFSMTNRGIKRSNSSTTVPLILAKKPKLGEVNKKPGNHDMTFDGFGGHAKYDIFPKSYQSLNIKKVKDKTKT